MKNLLLFVLLVICTNIYSQVGYMPSFIITRENDTIFGTGAVSKTYLLVYFKRLNTDNTIKYLPGDIKSFEIIDGKKYVSEFIFDESGNKKGYFVEMIFDGELDVFIMNPPGRFFIKKDSMDIIELNDNIKSVQNIEGNEVMVQDMKHLGYLRYYTSDAQQLYPQIDKMKTLNRKDLAKFSKDYHKAVCGNSDFVDYEYQNKAKDSDRIKISVELNGGICFADTSSKPIGKLMVNFGKPIKKNLLLFRVGIQYCDIDVINNNSNTIDDIRVPLFIEYRWGIRNFKPYVSMGFLISRYPVSAMQIGFYQKISERIDFRFFGEADALESKIFDTPDYKSSYIFGVGIIYIFN